MWPSSPTWLSTREDSEDRVRALGRRGLGVVADVTDETALRAAIVSAAIELGPFRHLVNVVGGCAA